MDIPKPGPNAFRQMGLASEAAGIALDTMATALEVKEIEKKAKTPFVPKPHLTHRPFVDPKLVALRNSMQNKKSFNRRKK